MPSEMATIIIGRPTHKENEENRSNSLDDNTIFGDPKACIITVTSASFKIINLPHEMTWYMHILVLML